VHDLDVFGDLFGKQKLVGFLLGLGEHDGLALAVADQNVGESGNSVVVRAVDGQMRHSFGSLVLQVLHQINLRVARLEEHRRDRRNPSGYSRGEHEALEVLGSVRLDSAHNLLDILLETQVQHNVSFVEHGHLEGAEIEVFAFHVVLDAPSGSNENVNSTA